MATPEDVAKAEALAFELLLTKPKIAKALGRYGAEEFSELTTADMNQVLTSLEKKVEDQINV